jgi:TonB-linked SusC/RagA family outer membrane protein
MKLPVYSNPVPKNRPLFSKTLLIMKLMTALILAATLHVSANSYTQQVTLSTKNTSIESVFKDIRRQTGYEFIYDKAWLQVAKKINIAVTKASLQKTLDLCFKEQPFTYIIHEKTIILQPREVMHLNEFNAFIPLPPQEIEGVIRDAKGNPIEGATITLLPSQRTTASNQLGAFSFPNVPNGRHAVWVTYVGYKKAVQSVNVSNAAISLTITMEEEVNSMEDFSVISTGYQALPRERATGSFGIISKEQIDKPTTNISTRLIGAVAGLQAKKIDENGNPTLELRGQSSLSGNATSPLVVVDGFPIQGEFNSINPNDVESITVLKDAAAASIWGARSANGVIVIVTKTARKGMPLKVDVSSFARIAPKLDLSYVNPLASSAETVDYEKRAFNKWGGQVNTGSLLSNYYFQWVGATEAMSEQYLGFLTVPQRDAILEKLKTQDNRQQIRDNLLANPLTQQYNLSIQGSTGKMSNTLSLLYESNQSNFKETYNKRYMLNYRTQANVTSWLDFNLSTFVQYVDAHNNGVALSDIQGLSPYEMLKDENDKLTNISRFYWPIMQRFVTAAAFPYAWTYNPIQEIENRDLSSKQLNTRVQAGLTAKIIKGLSVESKIQYELFHTFNRNLYNDNTFYVRNLINTSAAWNMNVATTPTLNLPKGGILTQNRAKGENYVFRNQVNFSRAFADKHQVDFVAGAEIQNFVTEGFSNPTTYGYNDGSLTVANFPNGPGGTPTGTGTTYQLKNWLNSNLTPISYINSFSYQTSRYFSAFGNLAYTYNNKYTVSASYRTDASNLITDDPKYRYDPFWSVGGSWQLYREKFFKARFVDRLSIRATYGYNGNVDRSTSFMPLINMGTAPNAYTNELTATISSYGNPTLRWEKTGTVNLGADYSLFKGKLFGRVDVYQKKGKDLLATISIPAVYGTTSQKINNAKMTNKGIELEIGSALTITKNISWRGSMNISYNQNRITNLFVATYTSSTLSGGGSGAYVVGKDANTMWTYEYAGVQNTQPMVKGEKGTFYDFTAFTPGDARNYMTASGTTVAPYTLGMINSFSVYDFNVSFILTGKFGHVFKRTGFNYPVTWTGRVLPNNKLSEVVNGNASQVVPLPLNENEPRFYFWDRFYPYLSYLVESASHVRLQELNVNYNLKKLVSKTGIKGAQVFAQGNDLLTIKANKFGEDPEYPIGGLKPQPRYTFGVKFEL